MRAPLLSLALLSACGNPEAELSLPATIAWAPQIDCNAGAADLGANMRALLDVGGHDACDLEVEPSTLEVSGECERITVGIVRPVGLGYYYPDGSGDLLGLALIVGWVDLTKDSLGTDGTVEVALTGDGVTSVLIDTNAERDAMPAANDCAGVVDPTEKQLCEAQVWARLPIAKRAVDFDRDSDGTPNLVEACASTLLD